MRISLSTILISGLFIVLIWKKLTNDIKTGWMPLLFWVIIRGVTWATANNMLENTMTVFVLLSVLFYLKSREKQKIVWLILSGLALFGGLLSKGFFCLYIWSFPFFMWVFKKDQKFLVMISDTLILVLSTALPVLLLYYFYEPSNNNMTHYFNMQVLNSIQNVKTVSSRFSILFKFLENIIAPVALGLILLIFNHRFNKENKVIFKDTAISLAFFEVVLSGILPIMISLKQRPFYITSVYPLFAIGLAYLLYPILTKEIILFQKNQKWIKIFKIASYAVLSLGIILSIMQANIIGRDKNLIVDCKTVINVAGKNNTINISPEMRPYWLLHGYFSRYGNISLDFEQKSLHSYYLTPKGRKPDIFSDKYEPIDVNLNDFVLYKLK